jgi:hypothetical protein
MPKTESGRHDSEHRHARCHLNMTGHCLRCSEGLYQSRLQHSLEAAASGIQKNRVATQTWRGPGRTSHKNGTGIPNGEERRSQCQWPHTTIRPKVTKIEIKNVQCYKRMLRTGKENVNAGADHLVFIVSHSDLLWKGWPESSSYPTRAN